MKRSVLAALALLLVLCCGADEFGSFQVVNPSGVASPEYRTETWLFTVGQDTSAIDDANLYAATGGAAIDSVVDLSSVYKWDDVATRIAAVGGADSIDASGRRWWYDDFTLAQYAYIWQSNNSRIWPNVSQLTCAAMTYWPLEDYLPANCTIRSAMMGLSTGTLAANMAASTSMAETLFAVLDTISTDNLWMTGPNTGTTTAKFLGKTAASWYAQIQPVLVNDSTNVNRRAGYKLLAAISDTGAWDPPLSSRKMSIDWGPRGKGWLPTETYSGAEDTLEIAIDCTRPVQYIVRGAVNNGLWLLYSANPVAARTSNIRLYFGPSADARKPWMVVKWSTKRHTWPWPGDKEVAFSFRTDDAVADVNDTLSAIFGNRGLSYTIGVIGYRAVTKQRTGPGDTLVYAGGQRLLNWFNRGMELVSHGRQHDPGGGTKHGVAGVTADLSDDSAAGGDSLYFIMQPGWLDSLLGAASATMDSADFAAHALTGRGYLFAQNVFTLRSLLVADSLGYAFAGTGVIGGSAKRPAPGDSTGAEVGGPAANKWRRSYGITTPRKLNRLIVPTGPHAGTADGIDIIFGTPGSAVSDSAAIKKSIRGWIEQAAVRDNGYMCWFTHNLLSSNHSYTADGINPDQAQWMLNALSEAGNVWVANMGTVATFWNWNSVQTDSPDDQGGGGQWDALLTGTKSPWYQRTFINQ